MLELLSRSLSLVKQASYIQKLHAAIIGASGSFTVVKYNSRTLEFLLKNLVKIKKVTGFPGNDAEHFAPARAALLKAVQLGERQIRRHAQPFDLQNFYTINEAVFVVELLCEELRDLIHTLELDSIVSIETGIPPCDVDMDRQFIEGQCCFIVSRGPPVPSSSPDVWLTVKDNLNEQLQGIVMGDDEIDLDGSREIGRGGSYVVYQAKWRGLDVAVKQLRDRTNDMNIKLARFAARAALNASVHHLHVAQVLAVSRSGLMAIELAPENLMEWYQRQGTQEKRLTLRVLHQAASGLQHLHEIGVVHRDVKSNNFLVFASGHRGVPTVKLCDIDLAAGQTEMWRTTFMQQPGTKLYFAPELDEGKPHSRASDVFSIGIVMCEVLACRRPYAGMDDKMVMEKKQAEEMPCQVPDGFPMGLKELVKQCLSFNPDDRPRMERVKRSLERLCENTI